MKKFALLGLSLVASAVMAAPASQNNSQQAQTNAQQPQMSLAVFNTSEKEPKFMEGNRLSRAKPRVLCAFISNVPLAKENNMYAYYFATPTATEMAPHFENQELRVTEDRKGFLFSGTLPQSLVNQEGVITQCWNFSKETPIGTYQLEVQVNDITFKGLNFEVLK